MIFTIPNEGHLNILKRMIKAHRSMYEFRLVLVDRRHTPPDLHDLDPLVHSLKRSGQFLNTPASQVFHRVDTLLGDCLHAASTFDPDLVIYDFCAVEGHVVARILGVPAWCSIPGLIGPFTHHDYLVESLSSPANQNAIRSIVSRYGFTVDQSRIEVISNCLHMPGDVNLLWSYPAVTPPDFMLNRNGAPYRFAGYLSDGYRRQDSPGLTPTVYVSFGTEVMDNLWLTQESTRVGVRRCVSGLAERWRSEAIQVVFVTQGKKVLDEYPDNWTVRDKVDQQAILSRADVFVTHGGSNSFHEAILLRVPTVVVPFFGDQVLVAQRAEELGIGIGLVTDRGIDKNGSKSFLNAALVDEIDAAVFQILGNDTYRKSFDDLDVAATPPLAGLAGVGTVP